jgi:NitT/TauT family transport system substrate-binding protein
MRRLSLGFAALVALGASATPALAQEPVRIGIGFGLAFLPVYICEDLKLIEKQAKAAHLDVKAVYQRFMGAAPLQDAIATGAIDMGPFGAAPLLAAWQKSKDAPNQIFAISGITSLPPVLLSNQPNVQSLTDLRPADHIAVPTLTSPQMYLLEMQSEKVFGQYDKLRGQVVAMPHADAVDALMSGAGAVTAYFSSAPFTQVALRVANVHRVLSSSDVINGKASFLIMGATKAYIDGQPQMPDVVGKAMAEAARIIHDDPRRAAQIYLTHEPSMVLNGATIEAVLREDKDEFGSAVYGMQAFADFMGRHGDLKTVPRSWKEIVAPALLNSPSS